MNSIVEMFHKYNVIFQPVAQNIGLDTSSILSLWQDRAMVEVNVAVLHSYQVRPNVILIWSLSCRMTQYYKCFLINQIGQM